MPYHVSWLLNFFVTTLPISMPRRSQSLCVRSGWDEPEIAFVVHCGRWRCKRLAQPLSIKRGTLTREDLDVRHPHFIPRFVVTPGNYAVQGDDRPWRINVCRRLEEVAFLLTLSITGWLRWPAWQSRVEEAAERTGADDSQPGSGDSGVIGRAVDVERASAPFPGAPNS